MPTVGVASDGLNPAAAVISTGPGTNSTALDLYTGFSGPTSFGSANFEAASSGTGSTYFLFTGFRSQLFLPADYVSGTVFSDTNVFANSTIASLGRIPGTYTYSYNVGQDSIVFEISAVPEPSTWAMMILGFFGLGFIKLLSKAFSQGGGRKLIAGNLLSIKADLDLGIPE